MKQDIVFTEKKTVSEIVAEKLLAFIKKNEFWGKRLPSQRELCSILNVGLVSVNKAIKILQDDGICVSYHKRGTFVVKHQPPSKEEIKRTKMLIISPWNTLIPNNKNIAVDSNLALPLIHACNEKNVDIVFVRLDDRNQAEDEKYILQEYPPGSIDYVAFISIFKRPEQIKRIAKCYHAAVMLDHYFEGKNITGVMDDGYGGMKKLTQHFIDQGHEKIAFMNISKPEYNPWKYAGFKDTMEANNLEINPAHTINIVQNNRLIKSFVEEVMRSNLPPTAFIGVNDARALYAKEALIQLNYNIGKEIAIAGYGDHAWQNKEDNELTSLRFDTQKLGEVAAEYLFSESPKNIGDLISVETELIIRGSTKSAFAKKIKDN